MPEVTPQEFHLPVTTPPPGKGRKEVPYAEAMPSTKRKRTQKLAQERELDELLDASLKKAVSKDDKDLAFILKRTKIAHWDDG